MDALKSLKVKTGTCRRIFKEVKMYKDEVVSEQAKTDKMKASGADQYDLKQQENVLQESQLMIPDSRRRLEAAIEDLQAALAGCGDKDSEEAKTAECVLAEALQSSG